MVAFAHDLRNVLLPALAGAGAAIVGLLAFVILQRGVLGVGAWRRAQVRARYLPALQTALDADAGAARENAMAVLLAAPVRHRGIVADALLEPLRVVRGSAVDRARAVAAQLGLLDDWRRELRRGGWPARSKAALALGLVHDPEAVPALVALLDEPHEEVRAAAVDALGMIGDVTAVQALLSRIGQQSRHQQARLVEALRRIGPAVTAAIVGLDARGAEERRLVADVLALVGGTGAREMLLAWTADADAAVRAAAWRAVGRAGMDERAAYHALRALGDADPGVRAQAAQALGRTGDAAFVLYLAAHLDDAWEVAAHGARALARMGAPGRAALQRREQLGPEGHGFELARHFLWQERQP